MINTQKIKNRIANENKNIQSIATKMACTPNILWRKISNELPINLGEILILCEELEISREEFEEFFLKKKL